MHCTIKLSKDLSWVGVSDRRIALFENVYPVKRGVSYNSYLLKDEKTVLFDTVDKSVSGRFLENVEYELGGRKLDYVVINHVEPDHCATLQSIVTKYPDAKLVINIKASAMLKQFFDFDIDSKAEMVKEGDVLVCGKHELTFFSAPMVHWPEVMVTYDRTDKILFSADAFGTFGAIDGNIFADCVDFEKEWLPDARRYYSNIVGKYGVQVTSLINKLSCLEIGMLCPLHGPVWRENIDWYVDKYKKWAAWVPEDKGVVIACASIYGNTETAVDILACRLSELGVKSIRIYDVSSIDTSQIVSECFRYSSIVFASVTYNGGVFCKMENLLNDIVAHNLQNRSVAFIENGSWGPLAARKMKEMLSPLKNINVIEDTVSIKSSLKSEQMNEIDSLAAKIVQTL